MTTDHEERIRQLAHQIWESEGHPHGRHAEHWRMAVAAYEAQMAGSRVDTSMLDKSASSAAGTTRLPSV